MNLLTHWATIAKNAFWWYQFQNICFICDRPAEYRFDEQWRLHNETGPAIVFSDGYSLFAHHGVTLPAWIIEYPDRITPETIKEQPNAEIRRVMMQKYGWEHMFKAVGAKIIDAHPDPTIGELWHWDEPDGTPVSVVRVRNGTPEIDGSYKWYTLRVRPQITNVVDAVMSTYPTCAGMTRQEYLELNSSRT